MISCYAWHMKILVCGSRKFADYELIRRTLGRYNGPVELAHGGAPGADALAEAYATDRGWPVLRYQADVTRYGKVIGHIEIGQMLKAFAPDIVVAFRGGEDTARVARLARQAGIDVLEVRSL